MIDRAARNRLAQLIRLFVDGQITNDRFIDSVPFASKDEAIRAVVYFGCWYLYDDDREHHLTDNYAVDETEKEEIARWILFLHSDYEYEWPSYGMLELFGSFLNVFTLGAWNTLQPTMFTKLGDYKVWPFIRKADYEEAIRNPKLYKIISLT